MIANIIRWSINNRFWVLIATALIIVMGTYALKNTPVDALPDLSDVQVIIKTSYPGQAPQVVEDQVTYPLSTVMLAVPRAVTVRGYSFFNDSYVYIIFEDGTDLYWARSRVLEYLNQVISKLPPEAQPELGPDATGVGWVYEYALVDRTGTHDISQLTTLQNWFLKYELQTVPGVSEVATIGGMVKQYQIIIDPNRLRNYGFSLDYVKQAIQDANQEVGGSVIEMGEAEYMVRASGYLQSIEAIEAIPLGMNENGTPILLADLAAVNIGPQMRRGIAELDGEGEVVGGVIVMRQDENALKIIEAIKTKLKQLESSLPEGVEIVTTYDRSSLIERTIHTLKSKLIQEFIVVILICALFLYHLRSSLIILISLPIAILTAFIIMYWQGINANIMSLGGIAIAIGSMVDAAIVMIENVHKHAEKTPLTKENRWKIIGKSATEVGPTLFFALLIISLSFLPVFALQAQEGRLFSPLAFTKTYAMAAAAALSITLVPVLIGYFIRGKITPQTKNPINRLLIAAYHPVIQFVLKSPKTIIVTALVLVLITVWPLSRLGTEFIPQFDEGDWMYMPTTLPALSPGKAQQLLQQTNKLIKSVPEVKQVFGKIGRAETATDPAPLTMIETVIQFTPRDKWRPGMTPDKLRKELDQRVQLPGVTNAWVMPIRTRIDMLSTGIKTPVGIKITGPSLDEIQVIGEKIEATLRDLPGTASVYADRAVGGRYVNVDIDREKAARFGLNVSDIHEVVRLAVGGINVTETIEGLERYPVNLRYPQTTRDSLEKLQMLPLITKQNAHIALADVADVYVADGPPNIKSENARLTGWVLVDIANIDLGTYIDTAKEAISENITMPPGYTLLWTGQYEYMARAQERLKHLIPITLLIIVLLLYLNFKNFTQVAIIMGALPLALIGGIWFLWLLNYNMSIAVGVGFIALAGVSIELGVVMLLYLNQAFKRQQEQVERENRSMTIEDLQGAIIDGAVMRVRPIMMTVLTIIIGLLPIMLGSGTGSEVMRRIAAPMVGGMVSSLLLSLIVIPTIYWLWKQHGLKYS